VTVPALEFPDPPLSDHAVTLRRWRASDTDQMVAGFSDALCQQFSWPRVEAYTKAHALENFAEQECARLRGEGLSLAVVDAGNLDRVWGAASIYDVNLDEGRAAVGYWLAPEVRGRGIAMRTVRLLAGWAFDQLAVARLELTCSPDNAASQRVAERCGFVREGVLRSHIAVKGGRRDTVMFSLLPGELR
jgi:RimJ/RimL family protein N-acetyltransferase